MILSTRIIRITQSNRSILITPINLNQELRPMDEFLVHILAGLSEECFIFANYFAPQIGAQNERKETLIPRRDYNQHYAAGRTASDWSASDVVLQSLGIIGWSGEGHQSSLGYGRVVTDKGKANGGGAIVVDTYNRSYDQTGIFTPVHQQSHFLRHAQQAPIPHQSPRRILHRPSGDEGCGDVLSRERGTGCGQGAR
jgi:hypothetical protein